MPFWPTYTKSYTHPFLKGAFELYLASYYYEAPALATATYLPQ